MSVHQIVVRGEPVRMSVCGDGPPLLLVMGLGGTLELWEPLVSVLAPHRRLITFDTPGLSGSPRWRYSVSETADRAAAVAREAGYDRLDVLGVSLGGLVAQEVARRHPALVRRLVLTSTGASPLLALLTADPVAMAILASPARYLVPPVNRLLNRYMMGGVTRRDGDVADRYTRFREVARPSVRGYYAQMLGTVGFDSTRWLATLRTPTLVLHGSDDPLVSVGNARRLAAGLPDAHLEVIPGGGHVIVFDQPEECAGRIEAFLDARAGAGASA